MKNLPKKYLNAGFLLRIFKIFSKATNKKFFYLAAKNEGI
jgi:hypothetical protein